MTSPAGPAAAPDNPQALTTADPTTTETPLTGIPTDDPTTPTPAAAGGPGRPGPTSSPSGRIRASDAERERVVARLHHALGEGRLDLAEAEDRTAAVYAVRFRDELDPLLADLPGGNRAAAGGADPWSAIWESTVWRARQAVWGPEAGRPTAQHCRAAVAVLVGAVVWVLLCAVVGAAVVAA
jgi:hypothetical protein